MQSLDRPDPEMDRLWGEEAVRRLASFVAGSSKTYSPEEVFGQHGCRFGITHILLMYPLEMGDIRRCVLKQFPYTLRYAVRGDLILVVAVSHQHRAPDYWVDRSSDS
jgi:hypothetical protein